jgi:hypothetical protein
MMIEVMSPAERPAMVASKFQKSPDLMRLSANRDVTVRRKPERMLGSMKIIRFEGKCRSLFLSCLFFHAAQMWRFSETPDSPLNIREGFLSIIYVTIQLVFIFLF